MDGRALRVLCLLLHCWLTYAAEADSETNNTLVFAHLAGFRAREPSKWRLLPQPRFFLEDKKLWGRRIPGLAKWSNCCGIVNNDTKIVGGSATQPNQFPWMAALVDPGDDFLFCGGSLINDRYVVTAAHCLQSVSSPQQLQVILGKHELTQNSGNDLRLDAEQIIIHPLYEDDLLINDIALVKLKTVLVLPIGDNLIAPICLPSKSMYIDEHVVTAGWGNLQEGGFQPDRLYSVELRVISNMLCGILNAPYAVTGSMICAAGDVELGGKDACQGDSGSPLMASARYRPSRLALLGITSWGIGCARPRRPGVYARVPWLLDWLVTNTADALYC